jgi:hypothetical protein
MDEGLVVLVVVAAVVVAVGFALVLRGRLKARVVLPGVVEAEVIAGRDQVPPQPLAAGSVAVEDVAAGRDVLATGAGDVSVSRVESGRDVTASSESQSDPKA